MAPPSSVAHSKLGLSNEEIETLRQHQQRVASDSASSSAATQGRLLLNPSGLQALARHFDNVLTEIQRRLISLNAEVQTSIQRQNSRATRSIAAADAEIARFRAILQQIDLLENEFDKIRNIREIVRGFRSRVDALERRVG